MKTSLKLQEVIFGDKNGWFVLSASNFWLQTDPVECGPFFCL